MKIIYGEINLIYMIAQRGHNTISMGKISCDKDFKKIIDDCKKMGHSVRIRDISYVYLLQSFDDERIVYKTLFGVNAADEEADKYRTKASTKFLLSYIKSNYLEEDVSEKKQVGRPKNKKVDDDVESISFDENRRGMEDDLRAIEKLIKDSGDSLDAKELSSLIKTKADLRVKLNDKFGASEKNEEQYVIVEKKYNHICDRFNVECYLPTKEDLMEMFDLVERCKK